MADMKEGDKLTLTPTAASQFWRYATRELTVAGKTNSPNLVLVKISGYKTLHRMHRDFFEETRV